MLDPIISHPKVGSAGKTGEWRVFKPVVDHELCVLCLECSEYCPENVIEVRDGKIWIDYDYCKGCLICKNVCKMRAIKAEREFY